MGIKLISNGSIAPWNTKIIPAVTRGLEGWFTFDTESRRFTFNRSMGKPDAAVSGTPVAYPTHGRFKGLSNFLETQIAETVNQTIVIVCKAAAAIPAGSAGGGDANTPFFVGNYLGPAVDATGSSFGVNLFCTSQNILIGSAARSNGSGGATSSQVALNAEVATDWGIRCVRATPAETVVFNLTKGIKTVAALPTARVLATTKVRIGSATTSFAGEADISAVAIYSEALTDAEIALVASAMRKRMARLGIAV
jgi:hypothetical protein